MTLRELQDELIGLLEEAQALAEQIAEEDEPSAEDEEELARKNQQILEVRAKIEKKQKLEEQRAKLAEERAALTSLQPRVGGAAGEGRGGRVEFPLVSRPLAFVRAYPGEPAHRQNELAYRSGMWLISLFGQGSAAERARRYCQDHQVRAMVGSTDNVGGYVVPEELANTIIANQLKYGVARRNIGMVWPMISDTTKVPSLKDGFTVYYPNQAADITASDLTFGQVALAAELMGILGKISRSLFVEDAAIALGELCADQIARKFAAEEDAVVFLGTANSRLGVDGIVTKLEDTTGGARKGRVVAANGHDTLAELDSKDITKLIGTLPNYEGIEPKWYLHKTVAEQVFTRLKMDAGGATLNGSQGAEFLGYPIEYVNGMAQGTAHSQTVMLFGDLRMAAAMGQARGVEVAQSEHVFFASDSIGIRGTQRVAVNVHDIGDTTVAGPMVALALAAAG